MGRRWLVCAMLFAGCAENERKTDCEIPAQFERHEGSYARPSDFTSMECQPGSMAGLDVDGLWYVVGQPQQKFSAGPVRFERVCTADGGAFYVDVAQVTGSRRSPQTSLTDDHVFFRRAQRFGEFSFVTATYFCAREEGVLLGVQASCFQRGEDEEQCWEVPVRAARFEARDEPLAENMSLVGAIGANWRTGFSANVGVHDGTAYVARSDGLRIVDVSDPKNPVELSHYRSESRHDLFNDVQIVERVDAKRFALVASGFQGVLVLDVTDPRAPTFVSSFQLVESVGVGVHRLSMDRRSDGKIFAVATDSATHRTVILDVTDPENLTRATEFVNEDERWANHAAFARDDLVYVAGTSGGLFAYDISNLEAPTLVGRFEPASEMPWDVFSHAALPMTVDGREIVLHAEEGYGSHLQVLDGDPSSAGFLTQVGAMSLRDEVSVHNFVAKGSKVYVSHYQDGIRVVDLSRPERPTELGHYGTWSPETGKGALLEGAIDVEVAQDSNLVFVADTERGLLILSDDTN